MKSKKKKVLYADNPTLQLGLYMFFVAMFTMLMIDAWGLPTQNTIIFGTLFRVIPSILLGSGTAGVCIMILKKLKL